MLDCSRKDGLGNEACKVWVDSDPDFRRMPLGTVGAVEELDFVRSTVNLPTSMLITLSDKSDKVSACRSLK